MSCCATTVPMLDVLCHPANEESTLKYEQQDQDDDDELYPDDDGHSFASARSSPLDPQDDYLRNVFETFDENKDGSISQEEMKRTLNKLGLAVDDHELAHMIEAADTNSDGFVDFEEFRILYQSLCGSGGSANPAGNGDVSACNNTSSNDNKDSAAVEQEEAEMREAFEVFDQNGDGFITSKELQTVLSSLGLKQGRRLADCEKMIRRVDSDGDGRVSFEEFKQMMALGFS